MFRLAPLLIPIAVVCWPHPNANAGRKVKTTGPLAPLTTVGRWLQKGGTAALKGKTTMARGRLAIAVRPRTQVRMKQAGVRSLRIVGFEFELLFHKGANATYYLRTFVHPEARRASLMSLSGRVPANGKVYVRGLAPAQFKGLSKPFATAARRLVKSASGNRCRRLAIINPNAAKRMGVKGRLAKRLLRGVLKARKRRVAVCRALAGVRSHAMTIRVDDVAYLARDGRGRPVGLVKGDLRLRGGKLRLRLRGFRALRP